MFKFGIEAKAPNEEGLNSRAIDNAIKLILRSNLSSSFKTCIRYLGVFPSDFTPYHQLLSSNDRSLISFCIVNTDPASEPGQHWVAFFRSGKEAPLEFFDSYGEPPETYGFPLNSSNLNSNITSPIKFSSRLLQDYGSSVCGHYCILFLYIRLSLLNSAHVTPSSNSSSDDFATSISIIAHLSPSPKTRDLAVLKAITHLLQKRARIPFHSLAPTGQNPASFKTLIETQDSVMESFQHLQHSQPWKPLLKF